METVLQALGAMKKASSIEIAARTGIHRDEVVNQLWDYKRRGVVAQQGMSWMPAEESSAADLHEAAPATEPAQEKTTADLVEEIPAFVSRPDDLIIPTVRGVNRELRRARAKVVQLEKRRDAVRELGKHKRLIREVLL